MKKKEHFLSEFDREKAGVIEHWKEYVLFCPTVERHCLNLGCFFLSENGGPKFFLFEVRNFIKPTPWLMEMWLSVI